MSDHFRPKDSPILSPQEARRRKDVERFVLLPARGVEEPPRLLGVEGRDLFVAHLRRVGAGVRLLRALRLPEGGPTVVTDALNAGQGACDAAARPSRSTSVSRLAGGESIATVVVHERSPPTCSSSPEPSGRQPGSSSIRSVATTTEGSDTRSRERTRTVPAALAWSR